MKCTDFENRIELLFDDNTPAEVRREMLEHLETCPACAEFYRQTKAAFNTVAPRVEVQAPAGLKARILKTAAQAENTPATARTTAPARPRQLWLRPLSATLSAAALIALVLLVFDPVGRYRAHAAGRIFRDAAAQLDKSRSFRLEMNVRTLPQENFSYIDAEVPFVSHRMWVEPGSGRWRLEKAGRIALSDGERILMWSPEINSGFIMRPGSGAIEDFATLLDPYTLLLREELNFAERRNASYSKQVGPETITLTVEAPAEGDFSNDYLSGTSIDESDTRREYRFDRTTGRLIGLKIEQT
uniref:anti-sigma factor family protein n=1 Tax=Alistipes putredinis TaxID=28117 RepID=UPI003FD6F1AF